MIFNPQHRLDLGALDLVSRDGDVGSYRFEVLADGFSPGSPEAVKAVVQTLWRDGDDSRITRWGNRETSFVVAITAADSISLADGEQALALELANPSTLKWTPPDGLGSATVFEILNGKMDPDPDDLAELRLERRFVVTLECRPWVRSDTLTSQSVTLGSDVKVPQVFPIGGSVRTEASVTLKAAGTALIEFAILFTDPAMSEFNYSPGDSTTWANAPEGRYVVWLKNPGVNGDVLTATVGSQVARTRLGSLPSTQNWAPIGTLDLGGRRDGTLGTFTVAVARNGAAVSSPTLRLFRLAPETSLTYIDIGSTLSVNTLIWDAPGVTHPDGGLWGDGASVLSQATAWGQPLFTPPTTALYAEAHANAGVNMTLTVDHYARAQQSVA